MRTKGMPLETRATTQLKAAMLLLTAFLFPLIGCHPGTKQSVDPIISFTQVPQWSLGDENLQDLMEGKVSGASTRAAFVIYKIL